MLSTHCLNSRNVSRTILVKDSALGPGDPWGHWDEYSVLDI